MFKHGRITTYQVKLIMHTSMNNEIIPHNSLYAHVEYEV